MGGSDGDYGDDTLCPIAHSTGLVGDRWSILIVRELLLGQSRFQDLQAQTGASSQVLAARLKRLEADGLVERHAKGTRNCYKLRSDRLAEFNSACSGLFSGLATTVSPVKELA